MKLQQLVGGALFGLLALSLAGAGCTATASGGGGTGSSGGGSSGGGSNGGGPPGCAPDTTVVCGDGSDGYSCPDGDDPSTSDSTISCSDPSEDPAGGSDYCCISGWTGGTTCQPDYDLTSSCSDPDSYGYQCADPTDDPTTFDASLNCSAGVPDSDGSSTDFCCTDGGGSGSSSGGSSGGWGGDPTSIPDCTADSSVTCSAGDGWSCTGDTDPSDDTLSCSYGVTDPNDSTLTDYCCFDASGSSSTCVPDDDITDACSGDGSFGYQCASGDNPTSLDSSLNCSSPVTDQTDPSLDDFCCQ